MTIITTEILASILVGAIVVFIFIYFLWIRSPYKKGADLKPSSILAFTKFFNKDYKAALVVSNQLTSNHKASIELYLLVAYIYEELGEYIKAAQNHELLLHTNDLDTQSKLAITTELTKDYIKANMPNKAITILSTYPDALSVTENIKFIAIASLMIKDYKKSVAYYDQYIKRSGNKIAGFIEKVLIDKALHTADKSKINKYIKETLSINPKYRAARFIKATSMIDSSSSETKTATEFFNIIKENLIRDLADLNILKDTFIKIGLEKELDDFINSEIEKLSNNPFIYIYKSMQLLDKDNRNKAIDTMERYLKLKNPKLIAFKFYLDIQDNKFLNTLLTGKNYYICSVCNTEYLQYHDDCKVCYSSDTLSLI